MAKQSKKQKTMYSQPYTGYADEPLLGGIDSFFEDLGKGVGAQIGVKEEYLPFMGFLGTMLEPGPKVGKGSRAFENKDSLEATSRLGDRLLELGKNREDAFTYTARPDMTNFMTALQSYATKDFPIVPINSRVLGKELPNVVKNRLDNLSNVRTQRAVQADADYFGKNGLVYAADKDELTRKILMNKEMQDTRLARYSPIYTPDTEFGGDVMQNISLLHPAGDFELIYRKNLPIEISSVGNDRGGGGSRVYQAALSAIRADKLARESPEYMMNNTLTRVNELRKPSLAMSNIARFGDADHIQHNLDQWVNYMPKEINPATVGALNDAQFTGALGQIVNRMGNGRAWLSDYGEKLPVFHSMDDAHAFLGSQAGKDLAAGGFKDAGGTSLRGLGFGPTALKQMVGTQVLRDSENLPADWMTHQLFKDFYHADGGLISKKGIMAGGLNLVNPKSSQKGPLNISMNSNNMLAKSRAGTPAGQLHRGR